MKPFYLSFFLLCLLLAACDGEETARQSAALATSTAYPTPTLAAGLPTVPPPTPTLPAPDTAVSDPQIVPTMTAVPTLTPLPTPTNTPLPVERIELATDNLHYGNYEAVISQLEAVRQQSETLTIEQQTENLFSLGVAYWQDGRAAEAIAIFEQLVALSGGQAPTAVQFYLGQAYQSQANYPAAIAAYQSYLAANSDMGATVYPLLADIYATTGDSANALLARETAVAAPAHRLTEIENRRLLAQLYLDAQNYPAAIAQYDAMRNLAVTEFTQGEMNYLAGYAELLAGNTEAAYGRFQQGLTDYPRAYETYQGLVTLVEAGVPVDDFQRGLVNFQADSFEPAAAAFARYIQANPESYDPEAHLYAAWAYEGLGNLPTALLELDSYANSQPAAATIERGKMLARAGDVAGALENYQVYLQNYPDGEAAPFAAWWSAVIAEGQGDVPTAVARYTAMADAYPAHEDTPEALFRAGWLANQSGDMDTAVALWNRAAQQYPANSYGGAALVWLMRVLPTYTPATPDESGNLPDAQALLAQVQQQAKTGTAVNYYALRAKDMVLENGAFTADIPIHLPTSAEDAVAQAEAEEWLRSWLGLEPGTDVRSLSSSLANDPRLVRGEKLWQLGLYEEAKRELEAVREAYANDALSSYQLALHFRDIGLYRSSILAAVRLPILAGQSLFELPKFVGRLLYPAYYSEMVLPLAQQYGYDPRLQFALLRQESLFESFATSSAVAQGLSQVIPDTGAYIAQKLNWPDYDNSDLYKPYVGLNFGAFYLDEQLEYFDGDVHAALSAYNAGPGNAARWHNAAGSDLDVYLETVDFSETRTYIERIFEGFVIYRFLYGG
jgi:soluble lytic murein transglycosylase